MKSRKTSERTHIVRQLSWDNRACSHDRIDKILNYADDVIAEVCKGCGIRIAEWGSCTGCGEHKRLIRFGANGTRFHSGACQTLWEKREEKRKKDAPKQPGSARSGFHRD